MARDDQSIGAGAAVPDDLEKADIETVYGKLRPSPKGLSSADAKARLAKYGRNALVDKEVSNLQKFRRVSPARSPT